MLAMEAVVKSLGVMKLPGVEHLKIVSYLGDVHVLPLTLRSTAQGVNLPRNPIPFLTHHAIPLFIHIYGAKSPPGAYLLENIKGGDPNLGRLVMFCASSTRKSLTSYLGGCCSLSLPGNLAWCSLKMIKELTTAVSIPSHAFTVHGVGCQDLIGSIYGIHKAVVILEYLQLVNSSMWVPHTSNLVVSIGECACHRHHFVV